MEKIEKLKDIDTFYSQKVIPLAFNESLSYMEQICYLIDYIQNTLVPAINDNATAIEELQAYVQMLKKLHDELEQKVDDNFNTLNTKIDNTKDELNTKIDNTKEELITIINGVNETLTNAINETNTNLNNHISQNELKFNEIDSSINTLNTELDKTNTTLESLSNDVTNNINELNTKVEQNTEELKTLSSQVTQNTSDIEELKNLSFNYVRQFPLIKSIFGTYYYPYQTYSYKMLYNDKMVVLFPYHYKNSIYHTLFFRDYNEYQSSFKNYIELNDLPSNLQHIMAGKSIITGYFLSDDFSNLNNLTLNYGLMTFTTSGNFFNFIGKTPEELSNKKVMIIEPTIGFAN